MRQMIVEGVDRSPTFRALISRLEATDVIVYVEPVSKLPGALAGRLVLLPYGGTQRYLRVQIALGRPPAEVIGLIGHELRHALEVAEAHDVHDDEALVALYKRIGDRNSDALHQYDTSAARWAGRRVQKEVA